MDSNQSDNKYFCNRCKDKNYLIECADGCGEVITKRGKNHKIRKYKDQHKPKRGNNHRWKGGIRYRYNYRYILMPDYPRVGKDGYVAEHIYVYQEYNKCCLLPWGEVHHIDPVREGYCNNMPWNLMGVTKWYHRTLDRTKNLDNNICVKCGSGTTYIKKNGRPMWYYDQGNPVCRTCYSESKRVKKERKKKDWTGTKCYLCGSDKTVKNHRGNYDWRNYNDKGVICNRCYKKEYKKRKKLELKNVTIY